MQRFLLTILALALGACGQSSAPDDTSAEATTPEATTSSREADTSPSTTAPADRLADILQRQPEDAQARFDARHPQQTLEFFGIEPGMTVVEALPGGGWYTKVLLPYLGSEGKLIGVDYARDMYPKFGIFDDEFLAAKETWIADWTGDAEGWRDADSANVSAAVFGSMPESLDGTADVVLFVRALHNMARFDSDGGYLTTALNEAYRVLRPGCVVGVVQHWAADDAPDEWAGGQNGYLKKQFVIDRMEQAGFELVAESNINANPKDQPGESDIVWRLPPTLMTSADNPELKAEYEAIGESNRMTLKFRKPE